MDMTPAEVATCICDIYEKLGRFRSRSKIHEEI